MCYVVARVHTHGCACPTPVSVTRRRCERSTRLVICRRPARAARNVPRAAVAATDAWHKIAAAWHKPKRAPTCRQPRQPSPPPSSPLRAPLMSVSAASARWTGAKPWSPSCRATPRAAPRSRPWAASAAAGPLPLPPPRRVKRTWYRRAPRDTSLTGRAWPPCVAYLARRHLPTEQSVPMRGVSASATRWP